MKTEKCKLQSNASHESECTIRESTTSPRVLRCISTSRSLEHTTRGHKSEFAVHFSFKVVSLSRTVLVFLESFLVLELFVSASPNSFSSAVFLSESEIAKMNYQFVARQLCPSIVNRFFSSEYSHKSSGRIPRLEMCQQPGRSFFSSESAHQIKYL